MEVDSERFGSRKQNLIDTVLSWVFSVWLVDGRKLYIALFGHVNILHSFGSCCARKGGVSVSNPPISMGTQSTLSSWLLGWFTGVADDEKEAMVQAAYGL